MRAIILSTFLLMDIWGCKPGTLVVPTYVTIDSAIGSYSGTWTYTHHSWQSHVQTIKTDSSYVDTIIVGEINRDSILIISKMGSYPFKFDGLSNSYFDGHLIEYQITPASRGLTAIGNATSGDNAGNADTVIYHFVGKR